MKKVLLVILSLAFLSSCTSTFNKSGPGILYTGTTDPIFFDNSVKPLKRGESCSVRALALVATGDASIQAAKNSAGITKVASADTEYFNILGIFGKACTIVKGE